MNQLRLYPVGEQDFEVVRTEQMVYVDKTAYVYRMTHGGARTVFLSRPRRFGKTLLCDTLRHYFLAHKHLFEGLAISKLETEWIEYPVMHFDMSRCKSNDIDEVRTLLGVLLASFERQWGISEPVSSFGGRLQALIERAHAVTGQKVVLIFDEYDSPLLNVIDDKEKRNQIRDIFNTFYGPVKSMYQHLRFVFITGITKFSQMSIFSTINNIKNISMDVDYEGLCGITQQELETIFAPDIETLASKTGKTIEQTLDDLRRRYDGYRFGRRLTEVYNPFSVIRAFDSMRIDNYWFDSATPASLIKILRQYPFRLTNIERSTVQKETFDQPFDEFRTALPILVQSGYLTIKSYDDESDLYTLDIPNGEVRRGLYNTLMTQYLSPSPEANGGIQIAVWQAMRNDDIEAALSALRDYLAALPYDLSNKTERDFETIIKVLFDGLGVRVDTEVKNARGRCDVVLRSATTLYVMELKLDGNGSVDDALAQINEKNYLIPYWNDKRPKVKVGVLLNPDSRTITDWKVVREPQNNE